MTWEGLTPPYRTIVADPPWHYDQRVIEWGRTREMPYSTMTVEEIEGLPVGELALPGSHLYLWTTNRYLEASYSVARAWGFDPVTALVWCKEPHGLGPGGRFTVTTEFVLFARDARRAGALIRSARVKAGLSQNALDTQVRGRVTRLSKRWEDDDCLPTEDDWQKLREVLPDLRSVVWPEVVESEIAKIDSTWFVWPRGLHSAKPAAFMDLVEQVSPGPYVELFARSPRLGWDSWGYGWEQAS